MPSCQSPGIDRFLCCPGGCWSTTDHAALVSVSFPRPALHVLPGLLPRLPDLPQHLNYHEPVYFCLFKLKVHNLDTILHSSKRKDFSDIFDENTALAKKINIGNIGKGLNI